MLQRVNFGTGSKFGTEVAKRYREGSEMLVFLGKRGRQTVHTVKTTVVAKYYGFGPRSFSTEGSFGYLTVGILPVAPTQTKYLTWSALQKMW